MVDVLHPSKYPKAILSDARGVINSPSGHALEALAPNTSAQLKLGRTANSIGSGFIGADVGEMLRAYSADLSKNGLNVDQLGRVRAPLQPSFLARSAEASGSGSLGVVTFGSVSHNVGGHFSTSNNRFTAPVSGIYLFSTGILSRSAGTVNMSLRLNAGQFVMAEQSRVGDNYLGGHITCEMSLAAGDYVDVYSTYVHYGTIYAYFSGYLLG